MLFDNAETNTKQGDIGEARAIYEYTKMGYVVARTIFDSAKYDLILDDGVSLKRVQVKTTRCKKKYTNKKWNATGYNVLLGTTGGNRKINTYRNRNDDDYDILFVLTEEGRCWSIPVNELGAVTTTVVGASGRCAKYMEYELK